MIRVSEIGWRARRALEAAAPISTVVAALSSSIYLDVEGEIVWLGPNGSTLHGRAILADHVPLVEQGARFASPIDVSGAREWRPPSPPRSVEAATLVAAARTLVAVIDRVGSAEGFGAILAGQRPKFPLERATGDARAFLEACVEDDAIHAASIGARLLGLGPGLTPAGDDLVGAAFFARRMLSDAGLGDRHGWHRAADELRGLAAHRTHRISATLLGDLFDGDAYAPLHELALALTVSSPLDVILDAARRLTRIGHSSGWDMLAGFLGGLV